MTHQPVSVVSQCSLIAWLNGLASGDQRRLTGSGSALKACSRRCAIQMAAFTLLITYFILLCFYLYTDRHVKNNRSYQLLLPWLIIILAPLDFGVRDVPPPSTPPCNATDFCVIPVYSLCISLLTGRYNIAEERCHMPLTHNRFRPINTLLHCRHFRFISAAWALYKTIDAAESAVSTSCRISRMVRPKSDMIYCGLLVVSLWAICAQGGSLRRPRRTTPHQPAAITAKVTVLSTST